MVFESMSEHDIVSRTPAPRTIATLLADLHALGVRTGMTLVVHSSLRSLGWVNGGPVAVVQALMAAVGASGTLVMPTQSGDLSDPGHWNNPPVPREWWEAIRETMPVYDRHITPSRQMGRIVETFRSWPGTVRSEHPTLSLAAWGRHAEHITAHHSLDYSLGEQSPLARVYDLDGHVLLLGVGYENNTSFHLAEYRVPSPPMTEKSVPVLENGRRVWKTYRDVDIDGGPFGDLGEEFERAGEVRTGWVGSASSRLFKQRRAVDFAVQWLLR
ncbi:MAG: BA2930 family N-acetyltransferase [Chloroflexota bacterium]